MPILQVDNDIRIHLTEYVGPTLNYKINKLFLHLQNTFGVYPTCSFVAIDPCIVGALTTKVKAELDHTVRNGNLTALHGMAAKYGRTLVF